MIGLFQRHQKDKPKIVVTELPDGRYRVSLPSENGDSYIVANKTKALILERAELVINPKLKVERHTLPQSTPNSA